MQHRRLDMALNSLYLLPNLPPIYGRGLGRSPVLLTTTLGAGGGGSSFCSNSTCGRPSTAEAGSGGNPAAATTRGTLLMSGRGRGMHASLHSRHPPSWCEALREAGARLESARRIAVHTSSTIQALPFFNAAQHACAYATRQPLNLPAMPGVDHLALSTEVHPRIHPLGFVRPHIHTVLFVQTRCGQHHTPLWSGAVSAAIVLHGVMKS